MGDVPDPPDSVAVPDLLVQARAANLAGSALGLGPAVHEFVARLRLPLADQSDLAQNQCPRVTKADGALRLCPRPGSGPPAQFLSRPGG